MLKKNGTAAAVAACPFSKKIFLSAKAALIYAAFFFIAQACIFSPAFSSASSPAVFVEKEIGAQQMSIFISGSGLPEMHKITFTCTYSVPHASIMDAIVSSPQPATAISVFVDTMASSLSVSINAASTILLPDNSRMVVLKLNNPSTGAAWPLMVVKALIIDNQNTSFEVPVSIKSSTVSYNGTGNAYAQARRGEARLFDISGRKISNSMRQTAAGFHLKTINHEYKARIVLIR
jgi:hypothetical protein